MNGASTDSLRRRFKFKFPRPKFFCPRTSSTTTVTARRGFSACYKGCIDGLDSSSLVIAWLDGPDADSGTCFEVGYAYAKGIPVIGVRTDFRLSQERGVNLMLSRGCAAFVYRPSFDEDVDALARDIARAVKKLSKPARVK